jgi:hypothetical protein
VATSISSSPCRLALNLPEFTDEAALHLWLSPALRRSPDDRRLNRVGEPIECRLVVRPWVERDGVKPKIFVLTIR